MADAAAERVLGLLGSPDRLAELVTTLPDLDDAGRRTVAGRVRSLAQRIRWDDDNRAVALAALGTVAGVRQVVAVLDDARVTPDAEDLAVRVLATRQPPWLPDLPAALLVRRDRYAEHARLVRAFVRAGVVARPDFPEYPESLVSGLTLDRPSSTVLGELRADPGLLDAELDGLLGTERVGRRLADHDRWVLHPQHWGDGPAPAPRPEATWQHALTTLAAEGALDRDRLLDAALGAFSRDWAAVDVGWALGLLGALAPTEQEVAVRQAALARLLAAEHGPVVRMAVAALRRLAAAGQLDPDLLLTSAPAALGRTDKGTVLATVALLGDAAAARPETAARIADVVAIAAGHERADVRERAAALLAELGSDAGRRDDVQVAGGEVPASAGCAGVAAQPDPGLLPVADADELGELFGRLIEEADDPAEIERLLEGVLRLAGERPRHGADVLARRAEELRETPWPRPWSGEDVRLDLAALALVWLRGALPGRGFLGRGFGWESDVQTVRRLVSPPRLGRGSSLSELLTRRVHEVARAVGTGGATSLSLPTTRAGSLAAEALQRRIEGVGPGVEPLPIDACLALLRVAPEERGQLHFPATSRTGRYLAEQLRALAERRTDWELVVDRAEREQRDPRHAARPTRVAWRNAQPRGLDGPLTAVLDRSDPLATFGPEVADGEYASRFDQVTAQWPLLLPYDPDLLAAHAHPRLYRGLRQNRSGTEPLLEFLGAESRPLGPPARSALLLGLSAKNASERARAVDAVLDVASRGTVPGTDLGATLGQLLAADAVVGSRVLQAMGEVARADVRAGDLLLDCLQTAVAAFEGRRDAHLFIDLLAQLALDRNRTVDLPEVFSALAAGGSRTQLARACRRVPQPN